LDQRLPNPGKLTGSAGGGVVVTVVVETVVEPENPENDGACGETSGVANPLENGSAGELTKPEELAVPEVLTGGRSVFLSVAVF